MARYRVLPTGRVEVIREPMPSNMKRNLKIAGLIFVVLLALLLWIAFMPNTETVEYALCRTFIELKLQYPTTMHITQVEKFDEATRIFYRALDSYGNVVSTMAECIFRPDPETGYAIDSVSFDRRLYKDPDGTIEAFNKTIPIVINSGLDLTAPFPYGDTLLELKID